jgi:hypothetical protein
VRPVAHINMSRLTPAFFGLHISRSCSAIRSTFTFRYERLAGQGE